MARINSNYLDVNESYLFAWIKQEIDAYTAKHPDADVIRLGIGDVTQPLTAEVIGAMHRAVDEMASAATFRGYGPEQGYGFLREAIIEHEYRVRGIGHIAADEIFVSDGSKCDVGNIQEIFDADCSVAVTDPVYPVYLDTNLMAGRKRNIRFLPATPENGFRPELPDAPVDLIYLCSPNNPTGTVLDRSALAAWVDYAHRNSSVILFDSAYSAYIRDPQLPGSIYEIPGADEVAIEFKSFSKTAGFTGTRCAFTVVPKKLQRLGRDGKTHSLHWMWNRRQCTKFNGVSYIVQRGAEAVYSPAGRRETAKLVDYYMENARLIREGLQSLGHRVYGGENAPYIWWILPEGVKSKEFFAQLLDRCRVVGTPGVGFGAHGEGAFRLTAFGDRERTREAVERIRQL